MATPPSAPPSAPPSLASPAGDRTAPVGVRRPGAQRAGRGRQLGVWLWPTLLTFALTVYEIGRPLLWEDELNSWDMARRSTGQLLDAVQRVDAVLGTYYVFLHGWMTVFGDSATSLRMPSALAMAGTAGCTALIGQRLFGRRAGLTAGLLFALTPVVTRYAHEARPYALVVLAATLSTLLLLRALDRPGSRRRWAAYALCVAAVGLLHLIALTVLAGHLVLVARRARAERTIALRFGLAALAGTAAAGPVVLLGRAHAGRQISWIPGPDLWSLVTFLPQLYASALVAGAVTALAVLGWGSLREERGQAAGGPAVQGPGVQGPAAGDSATRGALVAVSALAVLPPLLLWAVSHGDVSYFYFRYLLFTLPAWTVLAGAGLRGTRSRGVIAAVLVALAVLTLPEQQAVRRPFAHFWQGIDYEGAARTIEKYHRPGDAVAYDRGDDYWRMLDVGVRFYLRDELRPRDVFLSTAAADRADLWSTECPDPTACLKDERRIWLVVAGDAADPLDALPAAQARALRARYTATGTERLTGVTVALLVRVP
ncbi:glycosyltransferase family 39 protein [Streptomyces sp. Je 1-79]|uniref:glycosyltransferase family 39 protein n=1 Tax=Streptomyces sp. Je 1-79 TaxID=2943847 RepID=UPI0027E51E48|nr:glycosyltransferase family 39 protein [Streptomyces sp. Je 1-79]